MFGTICTGKIVIKNKKIKKQEKIIIILTTRKFFVPNLFIGSGRFSWPN